MNKKNIYYVISKNLEMLEWQLDEDRERENNYAMPNV